MNGLEEIVLAIAEKGEARGDAVKQAAEEKAKAILLLAQNEADVEQKSAVLKAERKAQQIKEAAKSAAQSYKLKEILSYKAKTVNEVISTALSQAEALPVAEYFALIEKLIYNNFHKNEKGTLIFSKKDSERIPDGFANKINEALKKDGAELVLGEAANIKNGFILSYGDIEENCTFDAVVQSKAEVLKDEIASVLFG